MTSPFRTPSFLVPAATMLVGTLALMMLARPFYSAFLAFPFALGPLLLPMILAPHCPAPTAQRLLTIASILYAVWFTFVFINAFLLHPDPQSGIALLFIGVCSLPVLLPLCVIAWVKRKPLPAASP